MLTFKKKQNSKKANVYVNYQQRAAEFSVGDMALPFTADSHQAGRVVAVYPGIGMVDLEFPSGSKRFPVEDLQRIDPADYWINGPLSNTIPGGAGQVPVTNGPYKPPTNLKEKEKDKDKKVVEVKQQKKALYWGARDRKYFANKRS